eukprot:2846084-Amphidinium_carterae.1
MSECACQHAAGEPLLIDGDGFAVEYGACRGWIHSSLEPPQVSRDDSLHDVPDVGVRERSPRAMVVNALALKESSMRCPSHNVGVYKGSR